MTRAKHRPVGGKGKKKKHNPHSHKRTKDKSKQEAPIVHAGFKGKTKSDKLAKRAKAKSEKKRLVKIITKK